MIPPTFHSVGAVALVVAIATGLVAAVSGQIVLQPPAPPPPPLQPLQSVQSVLPSATPKQQPSVSLSPLQPQPVSLQTQPQPQQQPQLLLQAKQPALIVPVKPNITSPIKPNITSPIIQVAKLELIRPAAKPALRIEPLKVATNRTSMTTRRPLKIVKSSYPTSRQAARPSSSDSDKGGFLTSLFSVDRDADKSKVGVHIPLIFDMTNEKETTSGKSKLDLSVLSGLISVNRDREHGKGPLSVTIFGIPIYTGSGGSTLGQRLDETLSGHRKKLDDSLDNFAGSRQLPEATMQLYSNVKRTGERGLMSLSGSLDKVSSFLKEQAAPFDNQNGRPATKADAFVLKSPQFKPEDLRPKMSEAAFRKFMNSNSSAHDHESFIKLR